jgi:ABC-type multidrug transport system, ATPase component
MITNEKSKINELRSLSTFVNAIECRELWKVYSNDAEAIRDLNLSFKAGKMYVMAGPNGAGKTTFLRMISTELLPTRGELLVLGHDVSHERLAIQQWRYAPGSQIIPQSNYVETHILLC